MNRNRQCKYLISVFVNDKCVCLEFSEYLIEIPSIVAKYPVYQICIYDLTSCRKLFDTSQKHDARRENWWRRKRGGRPTGVMCIETNDKYESVKECSEKTGASIMNIYQSIHSGYSANGYHYRYMTYDDE